MGLLQKTYIQKSKIFLLPLTGIIKDRIYRETNTYVSAKDLTSKEYPQGISLEDKTLIVTYSKSYEQKERDFVMKFTVNTPKWSWEKFETDVLMSNKNFTNFYETSDEFVYTFDMSSWTDDWNHFLNGSYSKLSSHAKELILRYRWKVLASDERRKLYCYLYPYKDECKECFSKELGITIRQLEEVGELCNRPNLKLENFICEYIEIEDRLFHESKD